MIDNLFLRPILTYGVLTWSSVSVSQLENLNTLQILVFEYSSEFPGFSQMHRIIRIWHFLSLVRMLWKWPEEPWQWPLVRKKPLIVYLGKLEPDRPQPRVATRGILEDAKQSRARGAHSTKTQDPHIRSGTGPLITYEARKFQD